MDGYGKSATHTTGLRDCGWCGRRAMIARTVRLDGAQLAVSYYGEVLGYFVSPASGTYDAPRTEYYCRRESPDLPRWLDGDLAAEVRS